MTTTKSVNKIKLTKEQTDCVNFSSGDLLIRGVAGSGKSYVILKRALKLNKEKEDGESVTIFTYTNSLVKYTTDLVSSKVPDGSISVQTVDSYCLGIYGSMMHTSVKIAKKEDYKTLVAKSIDEHQKKTQLDHRLYDLNNEFFEDEFTWITEKCISNKEEYIQSDRRGRGSQIRLSDADKSLLWSIYEQFRANAEKQRFMDWPTLYMKLSRNLSRIPEHKKIDYVLIDEAQDMTVGKLKVVKALTRKSLTIAADVAQKIYKTTFTWKEVGIDISGRSSKALTKSFRSTKQIVELAEDLMEYNRKNGISKNDYTTAVIPDVEGEKPRIVEFRSSYEENEYMTNLIKGYIDNNKDDVIGIICRTEKEEDAVIKNLYRKGIDYEKIYKPKNGDAKWSLLRPGVKVVKAHSSKGLEFDRVIIPYLDDAVYPLKTYKIDKEQLDEYLEIERSLLYVAMTRARATLVMLCVGSVKSRFIDEFAPIHCEVQKI